MNSNTDKSIKNIKTICADMVQAANSGHPGAPLGLSQFIHILYTEYINLNPDDPTWPERDIFILSNGHACAIQYLMNHLLGFIGLDDIKSFRSLYIKLNNVETRTINDVTPGHPEKNNKGIEISTGPLGQGVAASVGFAISSKMAGCRNKVYCVFGDGCYQEGISQEAFSTCSSLGLDNITFIYDFNRTTIDGSTELSMGESVVGRFKSLNFDVIEIEDEIAQIREALDRKTSRTKVIILKTVIGKDSELEGSCKSHGSPLGAENVRKLKIKLGIPDEMFFVSQELLEEYKKAKNRMRKAVVDRNKTPSDQNATPSDQNSAGKSIEAYFDKEYTPEDLPTRSHFANAMNEVITNVKFLSGCADLTPSINSRLENSTDLKTALKSEIKDPVYIRYGIREHSMFAIMNGISSHGRYMPIGATFLNFASYGLGAIRLACLDRLRMIYVLTHDSIGLGEDGPTHQPIEVLATLRALPNLTTFRPSNGLETRASLIMAIKNTRGPSAIILSRQKLREDYLQNTPHSLDCNNHPSMKGAYFIYKSDNPEITLLATGSEVRLAVEAMKLLPEFRISVVSVLSFEIFEEQTAEYKDEILIPGSVKISIEAMSTFGWSRYSDHQIGIDRFGRSGKGEEVFEYFGFTGKQIAEQIKKILK